MWRRATARSIFRLRSSRLPLAIRVSWTLDDLIGYVDTWSAVRGAERAFGRSPVEDFRRDLGAVWGDPAARRGVMFPLSLRVGRISP
jgi:hypothetical protein